MADETRRAPITDRMDDVERSLKRLGERVRELEARPAAEIDPGQIRQVAAKVVRNRDDTIQQQLQATARNIEVELGKITARIDAIEQDVAAARQAMTRYFSKDKYLVTRQMIERIIREMERADQAQG